jgi:hypothetical protein
MGILCVVHEQLCMQYIINMPAASVVSEARILKFDLLIPLYITM